jgi:hypothetical protein
MSLADLRTALSTAAKHGAPDVAAFAQDMLSLLAEPEKSAARTREWRRHKSSQVVTPDVTSGHAVTDGDAPVTACDVAGGRGALSGSHVSSGSPSLSGSPEPQRESACASAPAHAREVKHREPPRETQVTLTLQMPEVCTGIASMLEIQDVKGAWLKFCGHYDGHGINVAGKWQQWCVGEAKCERTERHRAATAAPASAPRSKFTGFGHDGLPEREDQPRDYNPNPVSQRNPNRLPQPHELMKTGTMKAPDLGPPPPWWKDRGQEPITKARTAAPEMTEEQSAAERQRQLGELAKLNGHAG